MVMSLLEGLMTLGDLLETVDLIASLFDTRSQAAATPVPRRDWWLPEGITREAVTKRRSTQRT